MKIYRFSAAVLSDLGGYLFRGSCTRMARNWSGAIDEFDALLSE
jgi:hypothetical protein